MTDAATPPPANGQGAEELDPEDFLRALLKISPEDAAEALRHAARRGEGDDDE